MELTEEQRRQVEANRAAAIAKRKAFLESREEEQQQQKNPEGENNSNTNPNPWNLFKCQKFPLSPKPQPPKFLARLEICSLPLPILLTPHFLSFLIFLFSFIYFNYLTMI